MLWAMINDFLQNLLAWLRRMDVLLLGIATGLTLFGLAMIASVSVFQSYQLTSRMVTSGQLAEPGNSFYLLRSSLHVFTGIGVMLFVASIPYRLWERFARLLFLLSIIFLFALFIPGLGCTWGTSCSWFYVGGFSLQPAEFLKLTLVFYLAVWLQKREQLIATFQDGFLPFVTLLLLSTLLVALQPDLGSFLVLSLIACTMFFIAGGGIRHLLLGGAAAAVLGLPIILSKDYIRSRFTSFLALLGGSDPSVQEGPAYQVMQALIAIGSGGPFGVGYGKSIQKFGYLPEVQGDMIFAAMAEELGFLRLLIILAMYTILVVRGYKIAREAPDRFGFLVATGITTWIAAQSIINISVNLSLFPVTGLTLPFISYGGSSLIATLIGVGVLLNISTYSTEQMAARRRPDRWLSIR